MPVDDDLLLEAAALGALLLHVGAGQVAVHERRLAGGQRPHDAQPDVGHAAGQRPLLAVDERICKDKKCNRFMGAVLTPPVDSAVKRQAVGCRHFAIYFRLKNPFVAANKLQKSIDPHLFHFARNFKPMGYWSSSGHSKRNTTAAARGRGRTDGRRRISRQTTRSAKLNVEHHFVIFE